jgi:hypothetical protein
MRPWPATRRLPKASGVRGSWVRKQRLIDRLPEDFAVVLQDVLVFAGPAVGRAATAQTWDHLLRGWSPH